MSGTRFENKKKKRVNRFLNTAIGIVFVLILVFAVQIFLGGSNSEEAAVETSQEEEKNNTSIPDPVKPSEPIEKPEENEEFEELEENEENETVEEDLEPVPDGEWQPVGTAQTGEFSQDFTRDSVNWNEMTRALRYATGLGENMIIWRLGNGGSATTALGVVSAPDQQERPYQVKLEWIDGQGWLPVEKQLLESNPYR